MRKTHKTINVALIFVAIGVFLCADAGYALRPPMQYGSTLEKFKKQAKLLKRSRQRFSPEIWKRESMQQEVKTMLYPACGKDASTVYDMIRKFPYIEEVHLVDTGRQYSLDDTLNELCKNCPGKYSFYPISVRDGLILEFTNSKTSKKIRVYYHKHDYLKDEISGLEGGVDIVVVKSPGFFGGLAYYNNKAFYKKIATNTNGYIYITDAYLPNDKSLVKSLELVSCDAETKVLYRETLKRYVLVKDGYLILKLEPASSAKTLASGEAIKLTNEETVGKVVLGATRLGAEEGFDQGNPEAVDRFVVIDLPDFLEAAQPLGPLLRTILFSQFRAIRNKN